MSEKEVLKALKSALAKTQGRVQAEWSQIRKPSGTKFDVLKLSIRAPKSFQIRALEEAGDAAKEQPGSPIKLDPKQFFSITLPNPYGTNGALNMTRTKALDYVYFPYLAQAIHTLNNGKLRADKFRIKGVETAARLAFGKLLSCTCESYKPRDPDLKEIRIVVPYSEIKSFGRNYERIMRALFVTIKNKIPDPFKTRSGLAVNLQSIPRQEIAIRIEQAYAEELATACHSLKEILSSQTIKRALKL